MGKENTHYYCVHALTNGYWLGNASDLPNSPQKKRIFCKNLVISLSGHSCGVEEALKKLCFAIDGVGPNFPSTQNRHYERKREKREKAEGVINLFLLPLFKAEVRGLSVCR